MLTRLLGTLGVLAAFVIVFYLLSRRRPEPGCDGKCGCCGEFPSCPEETKFQRGAPPGGTESGAG